MKSIPKYWMMAIGAGCVVTALAADKAVPLGEPSTVASPSNSIKMARDYKACAERVAAMAGKSCDIIFIGDSITQGWTMPARGVEVWEKYYAPRHALNFGVSADGTQHVLWRLEHMHVQQLCPQVAVILIGTNNRGQTAQDVASGIKAVLAKTQATFPGVKIILVGILPSARGAMKSPEINKTISTYADHTSVFYLDVGPKFKRAGDSWQGLQPDRLHLKPEAYEWWASEMEPLLSKLLVDGKNKGEIIIKQSAAR